MSQVTRAARRRRSNRSASETRPVSRCTQNPRTSAGSAPGTRILSVGFLVIERDRDRSPWREGIAVDADPLDSEERVGFEPTEPAKVQRFSRPPHSTTLPPLQGPASPYFMRGLPPRIFSP